MNTPTRLAQDEHRRTKDDPRPIPGASVILSASVSADAPAWASEEVAEEMRRFAYEFGPLIEQAADVQQQLRHDPEVSKLSAAVATAARNGSEGLLSPEALGLATRLLQVPAMRALGSSAASAGVRAVGFLTAQLEAALIIGAQAGAELVWVHPYKIGTFTTPSRVVARAWYEATLGLDVGISGTIAPYPFDLSFWFLPPEASNHMVGVFLGVVYGRGVRAELFGWVPEKPGAPAAPGGVSVNPFNYIYGFRLVVERGYHVGLGVAFKGHQVISGKTLQLSSYSISPSNIQAGWKYDGTATDHPLLEGVIAAPKRDEQPSKTFVTGTSTLQVSFPNWLCTALSAAPSLVFTNDGGDGTKGWSPTNTPSISDLTYTYVWAGENDQAWQSDIDFTISTCSKSTPPQTSATTCQFNGLTNVGPVDVPVSAGVSKMTLSELVFTAYGNYTLIVDTKVNSIEGYDGSTITANLNASTADSASQNQSNFYYLPNPNDATKTLIVDYTGTDKNFAGTSWYAGYQFQQQGGNPNAQFRPVFWELGKPFSDRYCYYGNWQSLTDTTQKYTSTATWSGGTITNDTTLTITLIPNPN
jgi:hypothetical protein